MFFTESAVSCGYCLNDSSIFRGFRNSRLILIGQVLHLRFEVNQTLGLDPGGYISGTTLFPGSSYTFLTPTSPSERPRQAATSSCAKFANYHPLPNLPCAAFSNHFLNSQPPLSPHISQPPLSPHFHFPTRSCRNNHKQP